MNKNLKLILIGFGVYLLTTGLSFSVFSRTQNRDSIASPVVDQNQEDGQVDRQRTFQGPRTAVCPINGAKYTEEQKEIWESKRPLLVMIENHKDSRPQSGLSRADVIYETVAEGGITRLMGVYYCEATEPYNREYDLGPVRSARTYFLDWASEYSDYPLYVHVGGAHCSEEGGRCTTDPRAQALEQISQYGWLNSDHHSDMNQFALSYQQCRREPERTGVAKATEHTMYCDSTSLWQKAKDRGIGNDWNEDFTAWEFKDEPPADDRGEVDEISFNFWEGYSAYQVRWEYDSESNTYLRFNGGEPHEEFLTGDQLSSKVVVVQFTQEIGPVDKHKHLVYETIDTGEALIFQDGKVIEGRWSKDSRQDRTIFTDSAGNEIEFTRGQIWIEVLPLGNSVDYEAA